MALIKAVRLLLRVSKKLSDHRCVRYLVHEREREREREREPMCKERQSEYTSV